MVKDATAPARIQTGWRLASLLVILVSGLVYLPSMNGLPVWDDHGLIGGNGIGGGKSLAACFTEPFLLHYFRPLVSVSFFADHKLSGTGPFFYHQTNLLIHVLTTLVCLVLFRAAFRSRVMAIAGALAFAVHPAQVSTVAWIGGRTDSLCTLWVTLFAWTLVRAAQSQGARRAGWAGVSTFAFGLALMTKEQSLALLPLVPLAFRCFSPLAPAEEWRDGLRFSMPYLAAGAAFVTAWCAFFPSPLAPVMHSLPEQAAVAGRTVTYYSLLLAVPTPTTMHLLSLGSLERFGFWSVLPGYVVLVSLFVAMVRGVDRCPAGAWFCGFMLGGLLPVSNLIPLPSLAVAPYRVGICGPAAAALIALCFAAGYRTAWEGVRALKTSKSDTVASIRGAGAWKSPLRLAIGVALLCGWGTMTIWGAGRWQDERMLFGTIVQYDPDSIVGRFNLTTALLKQHRTRPALVELDSLMTRLFRSRAWTDRRTALAALKSDPEILVRIRENQGNAIRPEAWLASLYGQRGFALLDSRDRPGARRSFVIGRAIDRANDDVNLGLAKMAFDAGELRTAAGYLRLVIAAKPRRAEAYMLFGHTYAAMGRWKEAQGELETWASLQPWSGQAHVEVAQAKSRLGDYSGARASLEYALSNSICDVQEVRARLNDLHGRASRFLN